MQDRGRFDFINDALDRRAVTDIGVFETNLPPMSQPIEILLCAPARQIIKNSNRPALLVEMLCRIHPNEAGTARNQYGFHAALMRSTNSSLTAPQNTPFLTISCTAPKPGRPRRTGTVEPHCQ
jgi:hypothetical protein